MDITEIIDTLEDTVERSGNMPFSNKAIIDRDELLDLIQELRLQLPDELKQAAWVKTERQRILADANKEAANILKTAEEKIVLMINEHQITKLSYDKAKAIEEKAKKQNREIKMATVQYVDGLLNNAENMLEKTLKTLQENRMGLHRDKKPTIAPEVDTE